MRRRLLASSLLTLALSLLASPALATGIGHHG
jgi:hypothetical protein